MKDFILLVHTGDHNKWVWHYWHNYFKKYWPFPKEIEVVFLCEESKHTWDNITVMQTGQVNNRTYEGRMWSDGLMDFLEERQKKNEAKYIIYMLEDFFLIDKPDVAKILELRDLMERKNYPLIKLYTDKYNVLAHERNIKNEDGLTIVQTDIHYPMSMQPSIWNRDFLLSCMRRGEKSWDNEIKGSGRMKKRREFTMLMYNPIVSPLNKSAVIPYKETMRLGKIRKGEAIHLFNAVKEGRV